MGGLISTNVPTSVSSQFGDVNSTLDLSLKANRDLNNEGSITSSGNLELSAGRSLNNVGNNSLIEAAGTVSLQSGRISNAGTVRAISGDVNLAGAADGSGMTVNNLGATISAKTGAINLNSSDFTGSGNTNVVGGNWDSKTLNIHSGLGTANVVVDEVTGEVTSTGTAVHLSADTDNLLIGQQCLTGDPTYYNTNNITITGNIDVAEDLAIIAGGNISTNANGYFIRARDGSGIGRNINIVAGANVTAGSGETSNIPGSAATGDVTFDTNSATGGNINLGNTAIDAAGTGNAGGGNVTIAAFADNGGANGSITTGTINASGSGTGANGNVNIIAGGGGNAFAVGAINVGAGSGTGANNGNVTIVNAQPTTSNGSAITFNSMGQITSGNTLIGGATRSGAAGSFGQISASRGNVTVRAGADIGLPQITANTMLLTSLGDLVIDNALTAPGGIFLLSGKNIRSGSGLPSLDTSADGNAGNLTVIAGADFTMSPGSVTINGGTATGGYIGWDQQTQMRSVNTSSIGSNGDAGDINFVAFAGSQPNGGVIRSGGVGFIFETSGNGTGANADITVVSNSTFDDGNPAIRLIQTFNNDGGAAGTGNFVLSNSAPAAGVQLSTSASNFAGVQSGTFLGGARALGRASLGPLFVNKSDVVLLGGAEITYSTISTANFLRVDSRGILENYGDITAEQVLYTADGRIRLDYTHTAPGGITVVSARDIWTGGSGLPGLITDNALGDAGNITLVAGAAFTTSLTDISITPFTLR